MTYEANNIYIDGIGKKGKLSQKERQFYDRVATEYPTMGMLYDTIIIRISIMVHSYDEYYVQYNYKSGTYRMIILYAEHQETTNMGGLKDRCKYIKQSKELKNLLAKGQHVFEALINKKMKPLQKLKDVLKNAQPFREAPNTCHDTIGTKRDNYGGNKKHRRTKCKSRKRTKRKSRKRTKRKSRKRTKRKSRRRTRKRK